MIAMTITIVLTPAFAIRSVNLDMVIPPRKIRVRVYSNAIPLFSIALRNAGLLWIISESFFFVALINPNRDKMTKSDLALFDSTARRTAVTTLTASRMTSDSANALADCLGMLG